MCFFTACYKSIESKYSLVHVEQTSRRVLPQARDAHRLQFAWGYPWILANAFASSEHWQPWWEANSSSMSMEPDSLCIFRKNINQAAFFELFLRYSQIRQKKGDHFDGHEQSHWTNTL